MNVKGRIIGFDILRIIFASLIFLRHSITKYGCHYFISSEVIKSTTGFVMTGFFLMSGYLNRMSSKNKKYFSSKETLLKFYKNKIITLFPSYLFLYVLYMIIVENQFRDGIFLLPIGLIGIQSTFVSLFKIFNFGGTWFFSCLILSLFVFPIISILLEGISERRISYYVIILIAFYVYAYYINDAYSLKSLYDNPFFRFGEFLIGVLIYDALEFYNDLFGRKIVLFNIITLAIIIIISLCNHEFFKVLLNNVFAIVVLNILLLEIFSNIKAPDNLLNQVVSYLGKLTYEVYLMQMVAWTISAIILNDKATNIAKIICSITVTMVLSIISRNLSNFVRLISKGNKEV